MDSFGWEKKPVLVSIVLRNRGFKELCWGSSKIIFWLSGLAVNFNMNNSVAQMTTASEGCRN